MPTRRKQIAHRLQDPWKVQTHVVYNQLSGAVRVLTMPLVVGDDYQAPLTSNTLAPNSKWLIVRNNLHRIRAFGVARRRAENASTFSNLYLFFQMIRELKRAEQQIHALADRASFRPVHYFSLPKDEGSRERFDVSHVQPDESLHYAGLGTEPIVLQHLLYYFSKERPVSRDDIMYSFLYSVNSVLHTNRQRMRRVSAFRTIALILTILAFCLLLLMFAMMILSVWKTMSNFRTTYEVGNYHHIKRNGTLMLLRRH